MVREKHSFRLVNHTTTHIRLSHHLRMLQIDQKSKNKQSLLYRCDDNKLVRGRLL
jgi:hypothetical protein